MTAAFDPYAEWLGIPFAKRVLTNYTLLGIAQLEPRADVIQRAAAQRIAQLEKVALPARPELAKKLIGQIEAARACLLNSESKQKYDMQLRKAIAASDSPSPPPAQPLAPPLTSPTASGPMLDLAKLEAMAAESATAVSISKPKRRSSFNVEAKIQDGIMVVIAGGVLVFAMLFGLVVGHNVALVAAELPVWHESPEEVKRVAMSDSSRRIKNPNEGSVDHLSVKYMSMFAASCVASIIVGGYYLMRY